MKNKKISITKPRLPEFNSLMKSYRKIISTSMITNSFFVKEFEKRVEGFLGVKNAVAVSSCTSGLMLSMRSLRLTGQIIMPSFTFSATGHTAVWAGMEPVLVDVDEKTFNIDPYLIEEKITEKTSSIVGVHLWGNPAKANVLEKIAKKYKLKLIFDSAQAFGSSYEKGMVGTKGTCEVFSFSPTKVVTCGEGGIVSTNDDELAELIRDSRNYGIGKSYDCTGIGLNSRITEFNAALGVESFKIMKECIKKRKELFELYSENLFSIKEISYPEILPGNKINYIYFPVIFNSSKDKNLRDEVYNELLKENIETRKYYNPALHQQSEYMRMYPEYKKLKLPVTEFILKNCLTLPLYPSLETRDVERICRIINKTIKN